MSEKDRQLANTISAVLVGGVILSALVVITGGVMFLSSHGQELAHYAVFSGEPHDLRSIPRIINDTCQGKSLGIIQLGVVILIAVPICRVVLAIVGFAGERDWKLAVVSALVLSALIYSLFSAMG